MKWQFRDVVVIYIYLRSGEYVAVAQAEQEPGVELDAAVAILTGSVDFYLVSFASPVDYIPGNARLYLRPGEGASDATSSGAVPERLYLRHDS